MKNMTVQRMMEYNGYIYVKGTDVRRAHEILKQLEGAVIVNGLENRDHEIAFDVQWISVLELKPQKYNGENELAEFIDGESAVSIKEKTEENKKHMRTHVEKMEKEINKKINEKEEIEFENYRVKFVD